MEKPKFEFYTRPNGHNEFLEFYNNLPLKDQQKLLATINRIEKDGFTKKTQKTPSREIQRAKVIKKEYEEEQYANNKI